MRRPPATLVLLASIASATLVVSTASADGERPVVDNPYQVIPTGPAALDLRPEAVASRRAQPAEPAAVPFHDLDRYMIEGEPEVDPNAVDDRPGLPEGWVQMGDEVVPEAVAAGAEVRSRPTLDHLRADLGGPQRGLIDEICDYPEEVPLGVYDTDFKPGQEYPRRGTIYLNFTGGILYNGNGENSAENYSGLALSGHKYPIFGGGEERAIAVAQAVQADFDDWAIRTVYLERPNKTIPYVMTMVGGNYKDTVAGPSGGVAPSADCEDVGMRNVCYSFTNLQSINHQANVIGQEVGHTYGLGHTYGDDRMMAYGYATNSNIDMIFGSDCADIFIAPDQGSACSGVNKCHCGVGELQNDKSTISAIYAPPGPDIVEPTIDITSPADGSVHESGSEVLVDVDVWDDFGGYGWKVLVYQEDELLGEKYDYQRTQVFALNGLPDGTYDVVVEIEDQADHIVQDRISIHVGQAAETTGGETTGAGTTAGSTGEDTDSVSDAGTTGPGVDGEDGCSCRSTGAPGPAPWMLGLGLVLFAGARRRT